MRKQRALEKQIGLCSQSETWKMCSREMKVYKLEKNESERDVRVSLPEELSTSQG